MIIRYSNQHWSTIGILDTPDPAIDNRMLIFAIHAGGGNKAGYKNSFVNFSRLATAQGYSVFRFDLPREGESKVFAEPIDKSNAINDLFNYVKETYNYRNVAVIGHCIGGIHALNFSLKHTDAIRAVVLWHVAPILYALEGRSERPTLDVQGRVAQIAAQRKNISRSPAAWAKIAMGSAKLLLVVARFWLRSVIFSLREMHRRSNPATRPGDAVQKKVLVIINPSKLHYKSIADGMEFIRQCLVDKGYVNVDFLETLTKVFSMEWQNNAFQGTIQYLENLNNTAMPEFDSAPKP